MELWTAFIIGFAGSLHCLGMCGPIAMALPVKDISGHKLFLSRIAYNLGRIVTYSIMGGVFGRVGQTIFIGGYQQALSITLGILILLVIFMPAKYTSFITGSRIQEQVTGHLKGIWKYFLSKKSIGSFFGVGILNGLLPCGLVYMAIAGSISRGTPLEGALYMALFGLGTFPVMLGISLVTRFLGLEFKSRLRRLLPIGAVLLAALFILRGLSLGIPYISPKIERNSTGQTSMDCHPDSVFIESKVD